jgi:hypothetical protein
MKQVKEIDGVDDNVYYILHVKKYVIRTCSGLGR